MPLIPPGAVGLKFWRPDGAAIVTPPRAVVSWVELFGEAATTGTCFQSSTTSAAITLSGGNLTATRLLGITLGSSYTQATTAATKVYAEVTLVSSAHPTDPNLATYFGVATAAEGTGDYLGGTANSVGVLANRSVLLNDAEIATLSGTIPLAGHTMALAVDLTAKTLAVRNVTASDAWSAAIDISGLTVAGIRFGVTEVYGSDNGGPDAWTANFDGVFLGIAPATYTRWDGTAIPFAYADSITPSAVPVVGQAITPVYTARYSDTIAAGVLPIGGSTITPVYTARYSDTLTAGALPITGQAITAIFSAGGINYSDVIAPSALPIGGQTVAAIYTARYSDTITAGAVPIAGQAVAAFYTVRYSDTLTAGALPITGQTITPVFSAGTVHYSDTITPSALPIAGQTIAAVHTVRYADTIGPGALPLVGQTITAVYSANYSDTITPSALPMVGLVVTPVFTAVPVRRITQKYSVIARQTIPPHLVAQQRRTSIVGRRSAENRKAQA